MATVKNAFEVMALVRFFYKHGWTDLSKIEAMIGDKYNENVKKSIQRSMWMCDTYRNEDQHANKKNICEYFKHDEPYTDSFSCDGDGWSEDILDILHRKAFSTLSSEDRGGITYKYLSPNCISEDHKRARLEFCKDFIAFTKVEDPIKVFSTLIIVVEVWLPFKCVDSPMKLRNSDKQILHKVKSGERGTSFICFFDLNGLIYHKFVPLSDTDKGGFQFVEILEEFLEHVARCRKRDLDSWSLMFEDALPFNSIAVKKFLAEKQICPIEYPPFSEDLSLCYDLMVSQNGSCIRTTPEANKIIVDYGQVQEISPVLIVRFFEHIVKYSIEF